MLFRSGMFINLHSDHVIRHLRKPGDTRHYLPAKGLYRYVTSANYFGELVEWTGFAILTASPAAWVFVWWTFGVLTGTLEETAGNSGTERESAADGQKKMPERKITITDYDLWEKESLKSEENPTAPYHATEKSVLRVYSEDGTVTTQTRVSGRLLGGCMDCLVNLTGTSFDKVAEFQKKYRDDGILWFLESCDLNVMSIRRAMWHMKQAGWFENTKGFLIGRPLQFGHEMMGLDQYEAVMGIVREYHVPVIMDVSIGHLPPSMPVICGSLAEAVVHENKLTLEMRLR